MTDELVRNVSDKNNLRIAAVQFPVCGEPEKNCRNMCGWMDRAADSGAELVHFPETALSGYVRVHVKNPVELDRNLLSELKSRLNERARSHGIWVAYGNTHFEPGAAKPYNSLHLVNPKGEEVARYDKIFLTEPDVQAYTPGNRLIVARIKDFRVGLSICFDMRFPELYRRYMESGVNLVLISSYQAGGERAAHMRTVAPATLVTRASENGMYFSCSNTSERPSWHESMVIAFNGVVQATATRHRASLAIADLDIRDYEPFTNFIRKVAHQALRNTSAVNEQRLIEEVVEVF